MQICCFTSSVILNVTATVHMFIQQHLLPQLTITMKLSLFTHAHSSPLSLAARLHQWCVNCSCDNDSGWILSGQTSYVNKNMKNFHGAMFKLNAKLDADSLFYLLSHFECDSHTVQILTQWCLPPPLTSTVKSSLFTHTHSSPLSLAASYMDVVQTFSLHRVQHK